MSFRSRLLAGSLGLLSACLFLAGPARAQFESPDRPNISEDRLLRSLRSGESAVGSPDSAEGKANRAALTKLARYLAHRLTQPEYTNPSADKKSDDMAKLINDAEKAIVVPTPSRPLTANQWVYNRELGKALDAELKEVIAKATKPISRVNAARMLALTGRTGYEGLADTYVGYVSDDKTSDAVKLYALQGLKNLLALKPEEETKTGHVIQDRVKFGKTVQALIDFINRPVDLAGKDPNQADVVRFVRREAVRALAQVRMGVVKDPDDKVLARPALALLRVASPWSQDPATSPVPFSPAPSPSERIEALVGFCQMPPDKNMDLELATYIVTACMVDIVRAHGASDPTNPAPPVVPWKVSAARLIAALNAWKKSTAELPKDRKGALVAELAERASADILSKIEEAGRGARPDASKLIQWLQTRPPAGNVLFKGEADSTVWKAKQ